MTAPVLKTHTLGCKVNQYETELVKEALTNVGYNASSNAQDQADLCVINTCTVTNEGDAKSRQTIRRMARQNPDAKLVVMGCYATRAPDELRSLPNVLEVVTDKRELPDILGRFGVIDFPDGISRYSNRHRAYVKVQDGCLLRCSYCIIPKVRPNLYSRPVEHIVNEVERLVANGHREVVLTGIHLGHFGVDWNRNRPKSEWTRLSDLLRLLVKLPGEFRLRLSSIEATEVTRELIQTMADHSDKICPHLHVCLQSGSDAVLRRMRRRWGLKRFVDRCHLVREKLDKPALTTDIIVGFPGETDEDFEASCQVSRDVGFSKIHAFPFSARKDTPAFDMQNQISASVKSERMSRLAQLGEEIRQEYFQSLVGETLELMVESVEGDEVSGTTCRYAPMKIEGDGLESGELVRSRVERLGEDGVLCGRRFETPPSAISS